MAADVSRHEGADALRERLEALLNSRAASSIPEGPFPYDVPRQALRDEFESLLARVHSLERAAEQALEFLDRLAAWDVLNLAPGSGDDGPYWKSEIVRLRAVVLAGAARQEQTQDLGAPASRRSSTDADSESLIYGYGTPQTDPDGGIDDGL